MAYMTINCGYCGRGWEVYRRDRDNMKSRRCPHCGAQITTDTWQKKAMLIFDRMRELEEQLSADHELEHFPQFEVSYHTDIWFTREGGG